MFSNYKSVLIYALIVISAAITFPLPVAAGEPIPVRISVENSASHVQTRAVAAFSEELQLILGDEYHVTFYHSAALFRDRDVFSAMASGQVEMAVPGTWQLDLYAPNVAVFLLPFFFGRTAEFVHQYSDGPTGKAVADQIEEALGVRVLGRWLDLGHGHLFTTTAPVHSHSELADMRIRVAGGRANELRITALGGNPVSIAWTDLPTYLSMGSIDGVLTTHETVRSAQLWERGIKGAFEDYQYFPQYVPMIREGFWRTLSRQKRSRIRQSWDDMVTTQRIDAAAAQNRAREELGRHGVAFVRPSEDALRNVRTRLLRYQEQIVRELGIDPKLVPTID